MTVVVLFHGHIFLSLQAQGMVEGCPVEGDACILGVRTRAVGV